MRIKRKKKQKVFVLLVLLSAISIGYATLTTTLKLNGISAIKGQNWDIYWDNIQITPGSVTPDTANGEKAAAIKSGATEVEYSISLKQPGDFYEFTVDAVNNGTIDAMIAANGIKNEIYESDGETKVLSLPKYIQYSVKYANEEEIEEYNLLAKKTGNVATTETYKVRVEYIKDIEESDINNVETDTALKFKFKVEYVQADEKFVETGAKKIIKKSITEEQLETLKENDETITDPVIIAHESTSQLPATTDYRYMGKTPNNYIYFNCSDYGNQNETTCEKWRIIGIIENKIKIISPTFNAKTTYSSVSSYWLTSTLYETFNSSIDSNSQKYIDNATWYLGSFNSNGNRPSAAYSYERGDINVNSERLIKTNNYIALMYPSDYGYASMDCYKTTTLSGYKASGCINTNWLYANKDEWLLTSNSSNETTIFVIRSGGDVRSFTNTGTAVSREVLYLKSSVMIKDGLGTLEEPYQLKK